MNSLHLDFGTGVLPAGLNVGRSFLFSPLAFHIEQEELLLAFAIDEN